MTLPPNIIKEEIEKEAKILYAEEHQGEPQGAYFRICHKLATQFYLKGVGDREAIAKAAFEAGREERSVVKVANPGFPEISWNSYETKQKYATPDDYLASDEYKKLVGG